MTICARSRKRFTRKEVDYEGFYFPEDAGEKRRGSDGMIAKEEAVFDIVRKNTYKIMETYRLAASVANTLGRGDPAPCAMGCEFSNLREELRYNTEALEQIDDILIGILNNLGPATELEMSRPTNPREW